MVYDLSARALLLRAKFGGRRELLQLLARQLACAIRGIPSFARCSLVVPVPSHPRAALRRGFNPALELARPVARQLGLPLRPRLLRRRWRAAAGVKQLGARQREASASEAFRVRWPLRGERVLLIDDVMTTGSTVAACARRLIVSGAGEVRVAVWARTLPRDWGEIQTKTRL